MIVSKVDLHDYLDIDLAFVSHSFFIHIPIDFSESQIISKLLYRLRVFEYHTNNNHKIRAIYHYTLLNRLVKKYSIHIHPNTCGKRLSIAYLGTIIINDEARIGDYLRIHVGVVIGKSHGGVPHIGNNVYIGPGAKVFGDISISDNCKIGANAVVCQS